MRVFEVRGQHAEDPHYYASRAPLLFLCVLFLWLNGFPASANNGDIKTALQPYVARHSIAGAVMLVASKERIVGLDTVGYADLRARKEMRPDTLFWIASMGKPVAATALMMLVDEGRIRLDDPVEKYLREFRPAEMVLSADKTRVELQQPRTAITLRDLLSHQSGIRYSSSLETAVLDRHPLALRVQSYALEPLLFEPRTDFAYSDAGINTISRVIEVVTGVDYATFLQQRIFRPLNMHDTTFWPTPEQVGRLAKSYTESADGSGLNEVPIAELHYPLSDRKTRFPTAAGGLFSTAADLSQFCRMLLNDGEFNGKRYISKKSLEEMTRNQLSVPARATFVEHASYGSKVNMPDGYGLGWYTAADGAFQHAGAYSTGMRVDPKQGIATIWLIQQAGRSPGSTGAHDTFEELAKKLYGARKPSAE